MKKREITVVLISTAVGIGVVAIVSFFIVWIGFPAENPKDSFRDALSFAGGLFGGLATFGAAIIAAYLFNDWRSQHNKQVKNEFSLRVYHSFNTVVNEVLLLGLKIEELIPPEKPKKWLFKNQDPSTIKFAATLDEIAEIEERLQVSISDLLDRMREFFIVTNQVEAGSSWISRYVKLFFIISEDDFRDLTSLQEVVQKYRNRHEKYIKLRDVISRDIIDNLLRSLQEPTS